jgi:hypothetical protein
MARWLLGELSALDYFGALSARGRVRALVAALFMVAYDLRPPAER